MPQTPNSSPPDQGAYPPVVHSSQDYNPASSAPAEVTACCPVDATHLPPLRTGMVGDSCRAFQEEQVACVDVCGSPA